jgi:hypothetical protein
MASWIYSCIRRELPMYDDGKIYAVPMLFMSFIVSTLPIMASCKWMYSSERSFFLLNFMYRNLPLSIITYISTMYWWNSSLHRRMLRYVTNSLSQGHTRDDLVMVVSMLDPLAFAVGLRFLCALVAHWCASRSCSFTKKWRFSVKNKIL